MHPVRDYVQKFLGKRSIRIHIGWIAISMVLVWVFFFDSHSVYKRVVWHQQSNRLEIENLELRQKIEQLDQQLKVEVSDETIERLAREKHGMRREGETVYPIIEPID